MLRIDDHHDKFIILPLRTRDVTISHMEKTHYLKSKNVLVINQYFA